MDDDKTDDAEVLVGWGREPLTYFLFTDTPKGKALDDLIRKTCEDHLVARLNG